MLKASLLAYVHCESHTLLVDDFLAAESFLPEELPVVAYPGIGNA